MLVKKYTCPECGYTKVPTAHRKKGCAGIIVKVGDTWRCNGCDSEMTGNPTCSQCDYSLSSGDWKEVDMQL
jgi:hypothetical protein